MQEGWMESDEARQALNKFMQNWRVYVFTSCVRDNFVVLIAFHLWCRHSDVSERREQRVQPMTGKACRRKDERRGEGGDMGNKS